MKRWRVTTALLRVAFAEDAARQHSNAVEFDGPAQRNWRARQPAQILLP